jgi:hypothetical protein
MVSSSKWIASAEELSFTDIWCSSEPLIRYLCSNDNGQCFILMAMIQPDRIGMLWDGGFVVYEKAHWVSKYKQISDQGIRYPMKKLCCC